MGVLRLHLYCLRPGGAPVNLLTGRRSPAGAQRRGRWAALSPRRRHRKESALRVEIAMTNAMVFTFSALVKADQKALLEHSLKRTGLLAPVPPPVPRCLGPLPVAAGRWVLRRPAASVRAALPSWPASQQQTTRAACGI